MNIWESSALLLLMGAGWTKGLALWALYWGGKGLLREYHNKKQGIFTRFSAFSIMVHMIVLVCGFILFTNII